MDEHEKIRGDKVYTKFIQTDINLYKHELLRNKEFIERLGIKVNEFLPRIVYTKKDEEDVLQLLSNLKFKANFLIGIIPGALVDYRQWEGAKWLNIK